MSIEKNVPLITVVLKNGFEITGDSIHFSSKEAAVIWPFITVRGSVMRIEVAISEIQHIEYLNPSNVRSLK